MPARLRPLALALPLAAALALLPACGGGGGGGDAGGDPEPNPYVVHPTRAASASPEWWNGAVVYEIFVRSFRDSNGDGVGDLRGITASLDALNDGDPATTTDLGVTAIWLTPIHPSPSTHGYDITDLDAVHPQLGTMQDLDDLVAAAHARGIKVLLDFVPNHVSSQHSWFRSAVASRSSPYRDWFLWSDTDPGWTQPWGSDRAWHSSGTGYYYGVFWDGMPDLNWENPAVAEAMARAAEGWLAHGVDGFRLDAVRYLVEDGAGLQADRPGTHAALKAFADRIRAAHPDAMLVGETWTSTDAIAGYYGDVTALPGGDELGLNFDFPLTYALLDGVRAGRAAPIADTLDAVALEYPAGAGDAPFLSNHDVGRAASGLDAGQRRLAAALLLTSQGTPTLYYGDELGFPAGDACSGDLCYRTPMPWTGGAGGGFTTGSPWVAFSPGTLDGGRLDWASESADPGSLLSRYRTLIRVRGASPALQRGSSTVIWSSAPAALFTLRELDGEVVLVAHNLGRSAVTATLTAPAGTPAALFADAGASAQASGTAWTVQLPGLGSAVWRIAAAP